MTGKFRGWIDQGQGSLEVGLIKDGEGLNRLLVCVGLVPHEEQ